MLRLKLPILEFEIRIIGQGQQLIFFIQKRSRVGVSYLEIVDI